MLFLLIYPTKVNTIMADDKLTVPAEDLFFMIYRGWFIIIINGEALF